MNHPAVVPRLVARDSRFLVDDGEPQPRMTLQEPEGGGETDDPRTDDCDVERPAHPGASRIATTEMPLGS